MMSVLPRILVETAEKAERRRMKSILGLGELDWLLNNKLYGSRVGRYFFALFNTSSLSLHLQSSVMLRKHV
jgi:hypothetical protein